MNSKRRGNIHYALAVVVLAGSAEFLSWAKSNGKLLVIKKALPIRRPLEDLNKKALAPWQLLSAARLPAESEEELGTKEYINWVVADATGSGEHRRPVSLTITYYTGVQDQVPHVPEECIYQGGMTQSAPKEIVKWSLSHLGEQAKIAKVMFDSPQKIGMRMFVYYTIAVNGEFQGDRDDVRLRMINPLDTHLYYSKVEVTIQSTRDANPDEMDAIGRDLLDRTLAELVRSHWPRRGWERGGPGVEAKSAA